MWSFFHLQLNLPAFVLCQSRKRALLVMHPEHLHHPGSFSDSHYILPCLISCYRLLSSFSKHNKRRQSVLQLARVLCVGALAVVQRAVKCSFPKEPAGRSLSTVHQGQ